MKKTFRYGTIMLLTSLQYANHLREYFVENSEKTIAFYVLPRRGKIKNFVEIYEKGVKTKTKELFSPGNLLLWHIFLYIHYLRILFLYTAKKEKIYFINYLFTLFFLHNIVKIFRNIEFVCWVGDYWPMDDWIIRFYRWCFNYYHKNASYAFYQTDRINKKMNGKIINTFTRKTIVPGVEPPKINVNKKIEHFINLCFIGVLVPWQGVDVLLKVVAENKYIHLKIIGTGADWLVEKYKKLIQYYNIQDRVYFPNTFIYGRSLKKAIAHSHVGIALYEVNPLKVTYYADPAKVKQYMEYGLPIIMTNAAEVATYIKKFHSGIIVERKSQSVNKAIKTMQDNYQHYLKNLDKLNHWLDFRTYYISAFTFLEKKI